METVEHRQNQRFWIIREDYEAIAGGPLPALLLSFFEGHDKAMIKKGKAERWQNWTQAQLAKDALRGLAGKIKAISVMNNLVDLKFVDKLKSKNNSILWRFNAAEVSLALEKLSTALYQNNTSKAPTYVESIQDLCRNNTSTYVESTQPLCRIDTPSTSIINKNNNEDDYTIKNKNPECEDERTDINFIKESFDQWWQIVPNKIGQKAARAEYIKQIKSKSVSPSAIYDAQIALNERHATLESNPDSTIPHMKSPYSWLYSESYGDDVNYIGKLRLKKSKQIGMQSPVPDWANASEADKTFNF